MKSTLLNASLRTSAKGGLSRFMVETFITPSLYPRIFSDPAWRSMTRDFVIKSRSSPRLAVEILERNVRFRTAARRRYFMETFNVLPSYVQRFVESDDAPTRASVISGGFPEIMKFSYLGDEDKRRRELITELKAAGKGSDLEHWTPEDVLEACGCYIFGTSPFNAFCEEEGVYDLYTAEYIDSLARHLRGRKCVLELGAGNGRLSHLLRKRLGSKTEVIATDSGRWGRMKGHRPRYPVVKCDFKEALKLYEPDVVIVAWMPMNQDWTRAIREKKSVSEYVLIGNPESCGKSFESWGVRSAHIFDPAITALLEEPKPDPWPLDIFEWLSGSTGSLEPGFKAPDDQEPPFVSDGFLKKELPDISKLQLSRYDRILRSGNSRTNAFVRTDALTCT